MYKQKNLKDTLDLDPLRKRKLHRMDMVRKIEQNENIPPQLLSNHRRISKTMQNHKKKERIIINNKAYCYYSLFVINKFNKFINYYIHLHKI